MNPRSKAVFQHVFFFPFCAHHLLSVLLTPKKNPTEEWDALHPWFLGCRRTVRFTHELQELWITSLDTWKCSTVVVWRLGVGRVWKGIGRARNDGTKTQEAVQCYFGMKFECEIFGDYYSCNFGCWFLFKHMCTIFFVSLRDMSPGAHFKSFREIWFVDGNPPQAKPVGEVPSSSMPRMECGPSKLMMTKFCKRHPCFSSVRVSFSSMAQFRRTIWDWAITHVGFADVPKLE